MNIFIDIETIPTQRQDIKEGISVSPPASYKKQDSIDKWMAENGEAAIDHEYRKTALSPNFGEVWCIGYAVDDLPVKILRGTEREILSWFNADIYDMTHPRPGQVIEPKWIGHNILKFDLRFIWCRGLVNGLKLDIPYNAKPWDFKVFDTMIEWAGLANTISLNTLAKVFSLPTKDMDGSQVWDFIKAGQDEVVVEYCKADVELTREIYRRMANN